MSSFFIRVLLAACLLVAAGSAQPLVRISEFMAANESTAIPSAPGVFADWIELHNAGDASQDLSGWFLTDDAANPAKWQIPPGTTLAAGAYLVILANNGNSPDSNGNLQTNFALSAAGEYVGLVQPDLTVASGFGPDGSNYPPQSGDISYGLNPGDLSSVYFSTPTPGAPNSTNGYVRIDDLEFSVERGIYTAPIQVGISTSTPGAIIYVTLDGRPPLAPDGTPASGAAPYTSPLGITTTTVVRAAAIKSGSPPTAVVTHTYLYPSDIATQTRPAGYPTSWGLESNADYDVDPQVSQSAVDAQRFLDGFREIPTLSVSTDKEDLFGTGGIYSNTQSDIEKAVSAEYFQPLAGGDGVNASLMFQIPAGIRIQGGASRNPNSAIKHSMSLRFRAEYGASDLSADLFGAPAEQEFNSIHLRAMYNNSWIHSQGPQRERANLISDQWIRDSHIDMGNQDGGSGRYVHLFLNGLYWGVFNLHERPDNDHYAQYSDGDYDKDEVFGYNPGNNSSEERDSFLSMKSAVGSKDWSAITAKLDVDSYIDFYIGQHFGHNDDLKSNDNWRAAGGGPADAPWRFYPWDSERTLENPTNTGSLAVSQDGAGLIDDLKQIPEFRVRFADRAYKHLHHGGALTNAANRVRFSARVAELDNAIVGESARWGDDRPGGNGPEGDYTRFDNWLPAIYGPLGTSPSNGVLGNGGWFPETGPSRTDYIITAWKGQTWGSGLPTKIPGINPPQFLVDGMPQHGGTLPGGAVLSLTQPTGQVYFTTDGSDPRDESGSVQLGLAAYTGGPVTPTGDGIIKVRWKDGGNWSALNETQFLLGSPAQPGDLRIVELHYNPAPPSAQERLAASLLTGSPVYTGGDFQFVEILNVSAVTVNLIGCQLSAGVTFAFGNLSLAPGERTVVAERLPAFALRYPAGIAPAGQWSGALAKSGETVELLSAGAGVIDSVSYGDSNPWVSRPDGDGPSLEIIDPPGLANDPGNWRSSSEFHGTPGTAGKGTDGRILINEILANTSSPALDAIELVNTTGSPIDLSGWFLSDAKASYRKFRIPDGTILDAGGYVAFDESDFNNPISSDISNYAAAGAETAVTANAHGLSTGDTVTISGYGGIGAYNGTWQVIVTSSDSFDIPVPFGDNAAGMGAWSPGQPFALSAQGETAWLMEGGPGGELVGFVDDMAFGATLPGESVGRWPDVPGPFVPLQFPTFGSANSPPRVGPLLIAEVMFQPQSLPEIDFEFVEIWNPTASPQSLANWTLRGDVDYDFTTESIPAGGRLVVVGFNPADVAKRDAFLAAYGVVHPVAFAGPWNSGETLANSSGSVRLRRAGTPPDDVPGFYPQVTEDEVYYLASAPWPDATTGDSFNRIGDDTFGSDASSWTAAGPTPGRGELSGFDLWAFENNVQGGPDGDIDGDNLSNLAEYAFGLDPEIADSHLLPMPSIEGGLLVLEYPVILARDDVGIEVEGSGDLDQWEPIPGLMPDTDEGVETRKATGPTGKDRYFMRFRVTRLE